MLKKSFLLSPGPSKVPEDVLLDMAQPIFHHRTPQYQDIFRQVSADLKEVFRTQNDVFVFVYRARLGIPYESAKVFASYLLRWLRVGRFAHS